MTGEERRKWLQGLRRKIAEYNEIVYMQADKHEDNCTGDCKVCRAEARYIDSELKRKACMGEEVKLSSILGELFLSEDMDLYIDSGKSPENVCLETDQHKTAKDSKNKYTKSLEDMELTLHLDSALRSYGIGDSDELYSVLKNDSVNMKKRLRGGYKYLVLILEELGYEISDEMR